MYTAAMIKRFLTNLGPEEIFTTRALLSFGSRSAIDNATFLLVRRNVIRRILPGMFVLASCQRVFTVLEVAKAKAESFGRKFMNHPAATHEDDDLYREGGDSPKQTVFGIRGHTSAFHYGGIRVRLRALVSRKGVLQRTAWGRTMNRLWFMGKDSVKDEDFKDACRGWTRQDRAEVAGLCGLLPAWMSDVVHEMIASDVVLLLRKASIPEEQRTPSSFWWPRPK